ncbi:MAG: hypothetical protein LBR15_00635 [Methanobrevibacter sp.]|jgi:hypothetical protein|nr:hypothetical protein [Candidatus Methanovirga australis]
MSFTIPDSWIENIKKKLKEQEERDMEQPITEAVKQFQLKQLQKQINYETEVALKLKSNEK